MIEPDPIHATLAARFAGGTWRGVLLRGSSGVGKSDLTLRLLAHGWRLVADDRVVVWCSGERLWGRAPAVLHRLMEVRAAGVLPFAAVDFSEIHVVIEGLESGHETDRIPEKTTATLCGVAVPLYRLDLLAPSAAAKVAAICGVLEV